MVDSVAWGKTISRAACYTLNIRIRCYRVAAGAQAVYQWFYHAGAGKIGKACRKAYKRDNDEAFDPVFPQAEYDYDNIKRYPVFFITDPGHYRIKKRIGKIMVNEIEYMPV